MSDEPYTPTDPYCTGPFSNAFDCPVHDPRKRVSKRQVMKTFTPEQLEQMASVLDIVNPFMMDYTDACRLVAAQARVIAGLEAWCQKHLYGYSYHPSVILAELHRLLTEHGLTPPKDQP